MIMLSFWAVALPLWLALRHPTQPRVSQWYVGEDGRGVPFSGGLSFSIQRGLGEHTLSPVTQLTPSHLFASQVGLGALHREYREAKPPWKTTTMALVFHCAVNSNIHVWQTVSPHITLVGHKDGTV